MTKARGMIVSVLVLVCASAMAVWAGADASASGQTWVLHCGHMLDTQQGRLLGETTVLIEHGRIHDVLPGHPTQAGWMELDLSSLTCLPSLIDSHTHLTMRITASNNVDSFRLNLADYAIRSVADARRTLLAGFTTVRNLNDYSNESVALRNAINARVVPGPRIYTAGVAIGSTGGHADPTNGYRDYLAGDPSVRQGIVNSADDAVKAVRQHYKAGDDLIKIVPSGGVLDESSSGDIHK